MPCGSQACRLLRQSEAGCRPSLREARRPSGARTRRPRAPRPRAALGPLLARLQPAEVLAAGAVGINNSWFTGDVDVQTYDSATRTFDFMVRDFSKFALQLYAKTSSTEAQMEGCLKMIRKPVVDEARFERV